MNTALLSEFFGAVKQIALLIPSFSERKKKELEKQTKLYYELEKSFDDMAVSFKAGSRADELLGLADAVKNQEKLLKDLYIIYAKELR